MILFLF